MDIESNKKTNSQEDFSKNSLIKASILSDSDRKIFKELADDLAIEFDDKKLLGRDRILSWTAYGVSAIWIFLSGCFFWALYKSLSDFKPIIELITAAKENSRSIITFLIIQKIGFTAVALTIIISLYKLSRYLFVQMISYRHMYLDARLKISIYISTIKMGGDFSESLIEKFMSQKDLDHSDGVEPVFLENLLEKLTNLVKKNW